MRRISVLIADDHAILAEGLITLLSTHFNVVGVASNGQELVSYARQHRPDVIVTDITMPLLNGIDATKLIKKEGLRSKVVILTMHEEATMAVESLKAGASGCVTKRSASTELVDAVTEVFSGRTYVSPSIEGDIYLMLDKSENNFDPRIPSLSPRQREIIQLTAEGKSMKEIAKLLNISPRTVESHKYSSMQVLGLKSTAELVQYAVKMHLI